MRVIDVVFSGPGRGHLSRAEGICAALHDYGFEAEPVESGRGNPTLYETPMCHAPFSLSVLRRAFWSRAVFGLGAGYPDVERLFVPGIECRALSGTAGEVAALLRIADVAVVNGGQTLQEARAVGVPYIVTVRAADDQPACDFDIIDPRLREHIAEALDGWANDAARVARAAIGSVRDATPDDWPWVLGAARDTHPEHITLAEHMAFCAERDLLIAEVCGQRAGYVRFDGPVVSIALAPEWRGRGFGRWVLDAGLRARPREWYTARVVRTNVASRAVFIACGFTEQEVDDESVFTLHHAGHEA